MKEILLTIGIGLAGLLGFGQADTPPQQENDDATLQVAELSELDVKLYQARQASKDKNFNEALALFQELEEQDDGRYYWAAISGQKIIYRRQYEYGKALEVADRAENKFPEATGLTKIWKGDIEASRGNYDKAIQEYEEAELNYGQTVVNDMVMGETALKQATRVAIKANKPDKAAKLARKMAEDYPETGNPEKALAKAVLYEAMANGEMEINTLENIQENGTCTEEDHCYISKDKKIKKKDSVDQSKFEKLDDLGGIEFELEKKDKDVLEKIKKVKDGDKSFLENLIPAAQAASDSFTTCSVATESARDGFIDPIQDITRGDLFMTYPAAADSGAYHPGVDLNNWYDHVGSDLYNCSNSPADRFVATAAGCVQDTSTTDWGSLTITHNYLPYDVSYTGQYIVSQYGHADELYVSIGDPVGMGDEVGSIGGVPSYPCHLHFEIREPDHRYQYDAGYWPSGGSQELVGWWYTDPESFIDGHPGYEWMRWVDEGASYWNYTGSWTYLDDRGNEDDYDQDDCKYTTTTSSSSASASATLIFTPTRSGQHNFYMFVPWSDSGQYKTDAAPYNITSVSSTLLSGTLDFYGTTVAGAGTCDQDIDGDGIYTYSSSKRCDEWIEIGNVNLTAGTTYYFTISNNTGTSGEYIFIDDLIITYGSGSTVSTLTIASLGREGSGSMDDCTPPSSGDWNVTSDCVLISDDTAPENVLIDDGVTLTISGGVTLDVDLSSYHINIGEGSRLIIEEGAKVD